MKLKNVVIVVDNIEQSVKFYKNLFGLQVIMRQDGNVIMSEGLVLQDAEVWRESTGIATTPHNNMTELYFEDAYRFIEGLEVTQLHVFSYSERPGTQALKIDHVVSPEEKHRRSQRLLALSDEKTKAFYARHIGKEAIVLAEKSKAGMPMHGFTDNYIRVELEHDDALDNKLVRVKLGDFNEDGTALKGTII